MSSTGNIVRLRGALIPRLGRTARGVRLVRLEEGAIVAGVTANDADAIPESPDEQTVTELPNDAGLPEDDLPAEEESDAEEDDIEDEEAEEEDEEEADDELNDPNEDPEADDR